MARRGFGAPRARRGGRGGRREVDELARVCGGRCGFGFPFVAGSADLGPADRLAGDVLHRDVSRHRESESTSGLTYHSEVPRAVRVEPASSRAREVHARAQAGMPGQRATRGAVAAALADGRSADAGRGGVDLLLVLVGAVLLRRREVALAGAGGHGGVAVFVVVVVVRGWRDWDRAEVLEPPGRGLQPSAGIGVLDGLAGLILARSGRVHQRYPGNK